MEPRLNVLAATFVRLTTALTLAPLASSKPADGSFEVIWNVPSAECASFNVTIDPAQYGFTVNSGKTFVGDEIALLYGPGMFPEILANGSRVNGGIPQLGELKPHLEKFAADLQRSIPDANFSGLAVIDFESWTPWFSEAQKEYREAAIQLVRSQHPNWSSERVEEQAREDWEWWARLFLEQTLAAAEAARPAALWGYYQYPLCYNLHTNGTCPETVHQRNDQLSWLFGDSDALFPSIYLFLNGFTSSDRRATVAGRLVEAKRHADGLPVFPYTWFQYHDDESYLSDEDLMIMLGEPAARGLPGVVMWGATSNCNTEAQCRRLEEYLRDHLGPLVRELVRLTPAERHSWRLLMATPAGRQMLRTVFELHPRPGPDTELADNSVSELGWLTGTAGSFTNGGYAVNLLPDEVLRTANKDGESKTSRRRLEKMREWQSSLDGQLWQVKRARERSSITEEPGASEL